MTALSTPPMSLHRKLAEVMAEVERIPKRGRAPASMGGFEFVQVGDAADAIRRGLATRSVTMLPTAVEVIGENEHETSSGKVMTTISIRTTWTLTDGESGESVVIQSLGTGADTGDKATPKASTNAMKYALLTGFLLSTGDDPELVDASDRKGTRGHIKSVRNGVVDSGPADVRVVSGGVEEPGAPPPNPVVIRGRIGLGAMRDSDGELRQTPTGWVTGFQLHDRPRNKVQVLARDALAEVLAPLLPGLVDQTATIQGDFEWVRWEKDGRSMSPYRRVHLRRIVTDEFILPADLPEGTVAAGVEARPAPMPHASS